MKIKVIKRTNLPTSLSFEPILLGWLALDHFSAPIWLYGACATLAVIIIIAATIRLLIEEQVDVFK